MSSTHLIYTADQAIDLIDRAHSALLAAHGMAVLAGSSRLVSSGGGSRGRGRSRLRGMAPGAPAGLRFQVAAAPAGSVGAHYWELDLFSALARHDLLLAKARVDRRLDMRARVQLLLAISRARQLAGDDPRLLEAVEHFLVERDADLHGR